MITFFSHTLLLFLVVSIVVVVRSVINMISKEDCRLIIMIEKLDERDFILFRRTTYWKSRKIQRSIILINTEYSKVTI